MLSRLFPLVLALAPALAAAELPRHPEPSALSDYVRARAASDLGQLDVAAASFASAWADSPGDAALGLQTFRQAVAAGDMPLALRTARTLDASHALPPDGTLLFAADAIAGRDWKRAQLLCDRIDAERLFAFAAPVLRAWIAVGQHRDGLPFLDAPHPGALGAAYIAEHRALVMLATGSPGPAVAALGALNLPPDDARTVRLRVAAAATLAARGKRDLAATVLTGDDPAIVRARDALAARGRIPGAIATAPAGVGELFARVAADVNRQQAAALALAFARVATMLAPDNSEGWLVSASLLAGAGDNNAALAALAHVSPDDPFTGAVRDARLTLLVRDGQADAALAEAEAAARAPDARFGDWSRFADLLEARDRHADAAAAYARALTLAGGDKAAPDIAWPLLLQAANARMQAGDWPGAKADAEHALALAPDQPAVLNFLGYSELDRGEPAGPAAALIARASALAPEDPAITDSLGWSWYKRGDLSRAIPLLEQAARGAPAEADINDHLGDAYWQAGRRLEARYAWRAALVVAEPADAARIRAKIDGGPTAHP